MSMDILVDSKIDAINPVVEKLMRILTASCCPHENEFAVETALREALANAIVHGNHCDTRKKVRVCCGCDSTKGILIVVSDEGEGFDPTKVQSPLEGEHVASEHGRGIFLINLYMDETHFENGGREIHMRKADQLAEISSRRTHNLLPWIKSANQEIGSPSFKAADRIRRFHLHDRPPPQRGTKLLVDELRSAAEDRVDCAGGPFDVGQA